jgi:hypothetical protein
LLGERSFGRLRRELRRAADMQTALFLVFLLPPPAAGAFKFESLSGDFRPDCRVF